MPAARSPQPARWPHSFVRSPVLCTDPRSAVTGPGAEHRTHACTLSVRAPVSLTASQRTTARSTMCGPECVVACFGENGGTESGKGCRLHCHATPYTNPPAHHRSTAQHSSKPRCDLKHASTRSVADARNRHADVYLMSGTPRAGTYTASPATP